MYVSVLKVWAMGGSAKQGKGPRAKLKKKQTATHGCAVAVAVLHAEGGAVVAAVGSTRTNSQLRHVADDASAEESDAVLVAGAWRLDGLARHANLR